MNTLNHESTFTFLGFVSVIGIIGNLIVASVYWRKKDKQTSTFFILILAFSDLSVCSFLIPMTIYFEKEAFYTDNLFLCKTYFFMTTFSVPASCFLMTAISIDRYFCICRASKNIMTQTKAKVIVAILLSLCGLLSVIPTLKATITVHGAGERMNSTVAVAPNISEYALTTPSSSMLSSSQSLKNPSEAVVVFEGTNIIIDETQNTYTLTNNSPHSYSSNGLNSQCSISLRGFIGSLVMPFKMYFYDLIFCVSVIIISILYVIIYKEIYTRRKVKRNRKQALANSLINGTGVIVCSGANNNNNGVNNIVSTKPSLNGVNGVDATSETNNSKNKANKKLYMKNNTVQNGGFGDMELKSNYSTSQVVVNGGNHIVLSNLGSTQIGAVAADGDASNKAQAAPQNECEQAPLIKTGGATDGSGSPKTEKANGNGMMMKERQASLSNRRRSLSYGKQIISTKDIRTAFMLSVVTILFIVFYFPSILATRSLFFANDNIFLVYLYFTNSAINPMIYCFLNPNFRSDLVKLFFKRGSLLNKCAKQVKLIE